LQITVGIKPCVLKEIIYPQSFSGAIRTFPIDMTANTNGITYLDRSPQKTQGYYSNIKEMV